MFRKEMAKPNPSCHFPCSVVWGTITQEASWFHLLYLMFEFIGRALKNSGFFVGFFLYSHHQFIITFCRKCVTFSTPCPLFEVLSLPDYDLPCFTLHKACLQSIVWCKIVIGISHICKNRKLVHGPDTFKHAQPHPISKLWHHLVVDLLWVIWIFWSWV